MKSLTASERPGSGAVPANLMQTKGGLTASGVGSEDRSASQTSGTRRQLTMTMIQPCKDFAKAPHPYDSHTTSSPVAMYVTISEKGVSANR